MKYVSVTKFIVLWFDFNDYRCTTQYICIIDRTLQSLAHSSSYIIFFHDLFFYVACQRPVILY